MSELRPLSERMFDAATREALQPFSGGGLSLARIGGEAIDVWSTPRGPCTLEVRVPTSRKGVDRVLVRDGNDVPLSIALARGGAIAEFQIGHGIVETQRPEPAVVEWLRLVVRAILEAEGEGPLAFEPALPPR